MRKFGRKVPHLRCDLHTSFMVKRSKVRVRGGTGGWGYTVSAKPSGHIASYKHVYEDRQCQLTAREYDRLVTDSYLCRREVCSELW